MKRKIHLFGILLTLLFVVSPGGKFLSPGAAVFSGSEREATPFAPREQLNQSRPEGEATKARPIELADILSWKNITFADLTPDGNWFAYQLSPNEGDSEVVFRQVRGVKEYRFFRGETPRGMVRPTEGALPGREIILAANSRFAAFLVYPKASEAKRLRRERKRITPDACLVDLATGEKKEWPKIKRILFSGESANWLALHRFPPEAQEREAEKWTGADLILYDLTQKSEINIGNVAEFAFDKQGNYLAWIVDAQGQAGNGVQLRRLKTGEVLVLDSDKASYKGLNWTEKGDGLMVLKGKEDKDYEDKLYSVVAFRNFTHPKKLKRSYLNQPRRKNFPRE